jgi:hypothetical protein
MAVLQIPLDVPDDVFARLLTGEYVRTGGVIRDLAGRLVKLLDDASSDGRSTEVARVAVGKALTRPRSVAVGVGAAVGAIAGVAVVAARRKKAAESKPPTCVEAFRESLTAYLEAAREGILDAGIIRRLRADLDAVIEVAHSGEITVGFSPAQVETLVGIVADHTKTLAEENRLEASDLDEDAPGSGSGTVIDLRRYLEIQERIFRDAA